MVRAWILKNFILSKQPKTDVSFLLVSRLLGEKGIREYAAAAKIVKEKFPKIKFELVGAQGRFIRCNSNRRGK